MQKIQKIGQIKQFTPRDFYEKRNKILIWHDKGGLGDVFMQRMLLSGVKEFMPDCELHFACLPEYTDAVKDHPDVDFITDSYSVKPQDYIACYNTCVTIADRYENRLSPYCEDHRSDIWAKYCGVPLNTHDMKFRPNPDKISYFKNKIESLNPDHKPVIVFAPISKMMSKTLLPWQTEVIINFLKKDYLVLGSHKQEIPLLKNNEIGGFYGLPLQDWIAFVSCCDYVVSVDSALFHLGGGLGKKMTGIFTFVDGLVYGKYFDFTLVQKHRKTSCWDCGPCFKFMDCPKSRKQPKPCLTEISEEEIVSGLKEMLLK